MIALLQRVRQASVSVDHRVIAEIGPGLLALVAVRPDDDERSAERLLQRLLGYRVFADADGRMNCSVADCGGDVLLVPQFTLTADTRKGTRPGFSGAAPPGLAEPLFRYLVSRAEALHGSVASGSFGADMDVALINQGPVTFWLES